MDTGNVPTTVWGILAAGFSIPASLGAIKVGFIAAKWLRGESIAQGSRDQTVLQKLQEDLLTQRAMLTKEQADFLERVQAEVIRCYARIAELEAEITRMERERDRFADLGRWWWRRAHYMREVAYAAQARADSGPALGVVYPAWPSMELPSFEGPIPPIADVPK